MYKLTNKQKRFIEEYLIDLNATQAAIRAGYNSKTAGRMAAKLVVKSCISESIHAAMKEKSEQAGITIRKIIDDLKRVAKASEDAGNYMPAIKALELLGKHIGMFVDKHEISSKDNKIKIIVEYADKETDPSATS